MRTFVLAVCLLGHGLFACNTPSTKQGPKTLSDAFTLYEKRPGEKRGTELQHRLVDYESEIVVEPVLADLAQVTGLTVRSEATAETQRIQEELDAIERTLEPSLRLIAEHEQESRAFYTTQFAEGMILQDNKAWRAIATKELEIATSLEALAKTHVAATELSGRWDLVEDVEKTGLSDAEIESALDEASALYGRMSPEPGVFEAAEITRVANDLTALFRENLADLERLVDETTVEVDMEAALLREKDRLPISIEPYVHVEGSVRGEKSKRVGIPNQADVERVKREYEAYAELSKSLNELIELARDEEELERTRDAVLAALRAFAESLGRSLEGELEALLAESELADVHEQARTIRSKVERLVESLQRLVAGAPSANPLELADQALRVLNALRDANLVADLRALANDLANLPDDLDDDAETLATRARAVFVARADELFEDLQDDPALGPVGAAVAALRKLATLSKLPAFGDLEPGAITRRSFDLAAAPPGIVNLADTLAEPGDVLELRQKVTVGKPASAPVAPGDGGAGADPSAAQANGASVQGAPDEYHGSRHLEVRKYGLYTSFGAQILFYDRLHDGSRTFAAAPGVCYDFHYRPDGWLTFFDVVAPGLGLSVSAPSFEDGTELAVGVHVTLLNDLLQVGFARNLSVDDDPEMFFIGFDLIEAFQAVE